MKAVPFTFTPLVEFEWFREDLDKLIGQYIPGMNYNCTLEARHDKLREVAKVWEAEGKIKITPLVNEQFITVEVGKDGGTT